MTDIVEQSIFFFVMGFVIGEFVRSVIPGTRMTAEQKNGSTAGADNGVENDG
jgi:hypothetical protein